MLPPAFPQASHCSGIAHYLSGLTTHTNSLKYWLACPVNSLARVSRRVRRVAFLILDFTSLPSQQVSSFTVLILYRSLVVFSLGWSQPPFHTALPNSTTHYVILQYEFFTLYENAFQHFYCIPFTTEYKVSFTIGAVPTSLAATIGIIVILFSSS